MSTVSQRNLTHVIANSCDDPDCELHHPEVAVAEGAANETAQAWYLAGAFAVVREFQTQYDIQDDALVAITVALRNVEASQTKE